ncbi:MAG: hypothetical protein BIFFINMI_03825 [Phycisphaerae bacterium]|nr:hypothetical protein [Phycisphaerae bacterium]
MAAEKRRNAKGGGTNAGRARRRLRGGAKGASGTPRQAALVREPKMAVERTQLGVRIEKRLAKVLKALAEYGDMTVGQLLEDILLHAFEGVQPFFPETIRKIAEIKKVYNLDYGVHDSYRFEDRTQAER